MFRFPTGGVKLIPAGPFGRNITAVFPTGEHTLIQLRARQKNVHQQMH